MLRVALVRFGVGLYSGRQDTEARLEALQLTQYATLVILDLHDAGFLNATKWDYQVNQKNNH